MGAVREISLEQAEALDSQYRDVMEAKQRRFEQGKEKQRRAELTAKFGFLTEPSTWGALLWLVLGGICLHRDGAIVKNGLVQIWVICTPIMGILCYGLRDKSG